MLTVKASPQETKEREMPAGEEREDPRIVVGVDGSASSREALGWAVRQAKVTGSVVDAVIAWHFPAGYGGYGWAPTGVGDDTDYAELAAKTLSQTVDSIVAAGSGVTVRQRVIEGNPAGVLLDAADGADLLVVGSRGHGGFAGILLGSVSQHCVHHSPCPVVVIRGHKKA
jgi:nucleotide-binding universal stress UspA family protein